MTASEDYRGNSMREIYLGLSPWQLRHLPNIENKRDHAVLFQLPINSNSTEPPKPHKGETKWDAHHVRLPYAHQNTSDVGEMGETKKSRWEIIEEALFSPIGTSRELEKAILKYNPKYAKKWKFHALHELFEEDLKPNESAEFFNDTLPKIIQLALQLPDIVPCSIPLLKHGSSKSISLTQQQIACLLANAFLCTFPRRNDCRHSEYQHFPSTNFSGLFQTRSRGDQVLEKIKCICNYFRLVCTEMLTGVMTFLRRTVPSSGFPDWSKCESRFGDSSLIHISADGTIEDNGDGLLQVDFANEYLGGGVLNHGCVQEEIRFVICPELLISRLLTERLDDNECLVMMGCERFNSYRGYANSFKFSGDYEDETPTDAFRRRMCTIVAIDATYFQQKSHQYNERTISRELNKAFVGFKHDLQSPAPGVATGNWGCGAFNGDKSLKALIQLMVCCVTHRPLIYYTFGDNRFRDEFFLMYKFLKENKVQIYKRNLDMFDRFSQASVDVK